MNGQKIIEFIDNLDKKGKEYHTLALASFFVESLFHEEYDLEEDDINLEEIFHKIPKDFMSSLHPCAIDFFCSNEYRGKTGKERWNVVDLFLKKKEGLLTSLEKEYFKGLRNSYMGLYEVENMIPDKSLTLKSIIKHDPCEIIVTEKLGTRQLGKSDVIGGRIVQTLTGAVLAGGILRLSKKAAKKAKQSIEYLTSIILTKEFMDMVREEDPNPELTIKKMWVKEIAEAWFKENREKNQPPVLFNITSTLKA